MLKIESWPPEPGKVFLSDLSFEQLEKPKRNRSAVAQVGKLGGLIANFLIENTNPSMAHAVAVDLIDQARVHVSDGSVIAESTIEWFSRGLHLEISPVVQGANR